VLIREIRGEKKRHRICGKKNKPRTHKNNS